MWGFGGQAIRLRTIDSLLATPFVLEDVLRKVAIRRGPSHVATRWDGVFFAGSDGVVGCAGMGCNLPGGNPPSDLIRVG